MNSNHTPGPWTVTQANAGTLDVLRQSNMDLLAALEHLASFSEAVHQQLEASTSEDFKHRRANFVSRHVVKAEDFRRLGSFLEIARAAIAKAGGDK